MPRSLLATLIAGLLLAGCAALPHPQSPQASNPPPAAAKAQEPPPANAIVHFSASTDPKAAWNSPSTSLEWGLLFTRDDLVVAKEKDGQLANVPRYYEKEFLNRMATVRGIPNGEAKTIELAPGVYDWLVLIDIEGDGMVDGFLDTRAAQGPLAAFEFLPGGEYYVSIDREGELAFRIEPGPTPYLAQMDSVQAHIFHAEDALVREYVELVVQEIDALRKIEGDLCFGLLQADGDRAREERAYDALPAALKVRESALVDRILRSTGEERATATGEEAAEALQPIMAALRSVYGDDLDVLEDEDLFAANKDLGCNIHRDMLALTLRMPLEQAAPVWRYLFTEEGDDGDDEDDEDAGPVTNT